MTDEDMLAEVDDLLATMPVLGGGRHASEELIDWLARGASIMEYGSFPVRQMFESGRRYLLGGSPVLHGDGSAQVRSALRQTRYSLLLKTGGPRATVHNKGAVFDYFDEIRRIVSQSGAEVFFVDPYMDADFVERFMPHIPTTVFVRLLTKVGLPKLLPALKLFAQQNGTKFEVRSTQSIHDRFVFVDQQACYQSGASFKDGARNAPATISQIVDAFPVMLSTYEGLWTSAKVEAKS